METGQFKEKLCLEVCLLVSLVGLLAGALTNRGESMGCFGKMFLGWIGASLGHLLFGTWGPNLAGIAIVPAVLGAMVVLAIFWRRGS